MARLGGTTFVEMIPRAEVMVAGLTRYAGSLRSLRSPLSDAVEGVLQPSVEEAFASEGPGWAKLSPRTIEDRQRQGFSAGPILTRSDNLRNVATSKGIWHIDGQEGTAFVTELPGAEYGEYHITGTDIMPERNFLAVDDAMVDQLQDIFEDFIAANAMKYVAGGTMLGGM